MSRDAAVDCCPHGVHPTRFAFATDSPYTLPAHEIGTSDSQRCVWGSDWRFLRIPERIDCGPVLGRPARWLPDDRDRRPVLWETPARLFGFN